MKILLVSAQYPPEIRSGGIASYVANIAPALARRGHEVHILACAPGLEASDRLEAGAWVHRRGLLGFPGLGRLWLLSPKFADRVILGISVLAKARKLGVVFDVVEYPDWEAEGWVFALLATSPTVVHLHTPLSVIADMERYPGTYDLRLAAWIERFSARRADAVTSPSALLADTLAAKGWIERSKITTVPQPIDWRLWQDTPPAGEAPPTVQFCGGIQRNKVPEILVDAINILRRDMPGVVARFAGKFQTDPSTGLLAMPWTDRRDLDGCQFLGHVPPASLKDVLASSRVFVQPSLFESFGMATLEAMAAGRPVVVTETTGIAELIRDRGVGSVAPANDSRALADALRPFLADPAHATEVGERARRFVRSELDPDRIAELRERVYETAIASFRGKAVASARAFRNALHERQAKVPAVWSDWAVREAIEEPWKHFYLKDADHVLDLLLRHPRFSGRKDLRGVKVLDVGCTPAVSCLLACMGAEVVMLDLNPDEFVKAAEHAHTLGVLDRIRLVIGDAFKLPFASSRFDLVWNSGFIEHFDEPELILAEMKRVAMPGAAVLVLAPNKWTPHSLWIRERLRRQKRFYWDWMGRERSYSPRQLRDLMSRCGLRVVAASAANLRRSILDDSTLMPRFARPSLRRPLLRLMNLTDWIESHVPMTSSVGFMSGVIATVPQTVNLASLPRLEKKEAPLESGQLVASAQ